MKLLLSFLVLLPVVFSSDCNPGDIYYSGNCYLIPSFTKKSGMSRDEAAHYCQQKSAFLPSFHSYDEESFVVNLAIKIFGKSYNWIGLTSPGGWDDGSSVDYTNWAPGFPKHKRTCVMQYFDYKKTNDPNWKDDYDCSDNAKFLCQYASGSGPVQPTGSPTRLPTRLPYQSTVLPLTGCDSQNDFFYGTRCYSFNAGALSYPDAVHSCSNIGKTLAIFDSLEELNLVQSIASSTFQKINNNYWIALHRGSDDSEFYWPGGVPVQFENWAPTYPVAGKPAVTQLVENGKWENSEEAAVLPFVCSGVIPPS